MSLPNFSCLNNSALEKLDAQYQAPSSVFKPAKMQLPQTDQQNLQSDNSHTKTLEKGTSTIHDDLEAATPNLIQNIDYNIKRALSPLSPRSQSQISKWKQSPRLCSQANMNSVQEMAKRQSPTNHYVVYPLPDASLLNFNKLHKKNISQLPRDLKVEYLLT